MWQRLINILLAVKNDIIYKYDFPFKYRIRLLYADKIQVDLKVKN